MLARRVAIIMPHTARYAYTGPMAGFSSAAGELVATELRRDGVAILTLNAPKKLNALSEEMGSEFMAAVSSSSHAFAAKVTLPGTAQVERLSSVPPPSLRAVVLTGSGGAFSAGGNLDWLMQRHRDSPPNNAQIMRDFYARFLCVRDLPVPVIAAIDGPGISCLLACRLITLPCDSLLAAVLCRLACCDSHRCRVRFGLRLRLAHCASCLQAWCDVCRAGAVPRHG